MRVVCGPHAESRLHCNVNPVSDIQLKSDRFYRFETFTTPVADYNRSRMPTVPS